MTREEVWMMEMTSCCRLQLNELRKNLTVESLKALPVGDCLSYDCAAPQDETLFDTIVLFIRRPEGAWLEITGRVEYWSPMRGYSSKEALICRFYSEYACLEWLQGKDIDKECAEILFAECWPD